MATTRTYPAVVYVKDPGNPGYHTVLVADQAAADALGVPVFDTAEQAAAFNPPLEQPIPNIARTNNEEQFVAGKSQLGAPVAQRLVQTAAPVQNVFVKTGFDPATLALKAELPDGVDATKLPVDAAGVVVVTP